MTDVLERTDGGSAEPGGETRTPVDRSAEVARLAKKEAWKRRIPLLPALIFTIVVTQIPFVLSLFFSLNEWVVNPPQPRTFVWFRNYADLITNQFFLDAAWTSVFMTVTSVVLSVLLGMLLALLLDRKFFGQGFVRTLIITPFLIMPVVAGLLWTTQLFNATFGLFNFVLESLGFDNIAFVSRFPGWSIVAILVWQWSPFMMLILLAGLQGQDPSVLEAARVDGASSRSIFFSITLPQLRPFIELGTLLGSIYLIQVFDHIETVTGGGPGSTNLPFFIFQRSIGGGWRFGQASAFSIIVVIATIFFATLGLRLLSNLLEDEV